ncbi:hypothetical protein Hanom_Chr05g00439271 [Helianthus anomalus]
MPEVRPSAPERGKVPMGNEEADGNEQTTSFVKVHGESLHGACVGEAALNVARELKQGGNHESKDSEQSIDLNRHYGGFIVGSTPDLSFGPKAKSRKRPRCGRSPDQNTNANMGQNNNVGTGSNSNPFEELIRSDNNTYSFQCLPKSNPASQSKNVDSQVVPDSCGDVSMGDDQVRVGGDSG